VWRASCSRASRLESLGVSLQRRLTHGRTVTKEHLRFVEGFVSASLIFCVGPLAILGSLSDGLGRGINQLVLKSTLDFFAALTFAASFGWGVAAAALSVLVLQGSITLLGFALGAVLPEAHVAALTATGGLLLAGVGLRLLRIRGFSCRRPAASTSYRCPTHIISCYAPLNSAKRNTGLRWIMSRSSAERGN
jgi:uncharacterized membrane protein YqgA involved in biofilm formation